METDPFAGSHCPDWGAHGEGAFICSAGESGPTRDLRAVLCVQVPGTLARLDDLAADADVWVTEGGTLTAGFPAGDRRSGRTGTWMRAAEHDGLLRISFIPRGRPVVRFVGDGFVGTLTDNDATFHGARHWWVRTAELLGHTEAVVDATLGEVTCTHLVPPVSETEGFGVIGATLAISTLLGALLYLLR
jgi:hypothetical protein